MLLQANATVDLTRQDMGRKGFRVSRLEAHEQVQVGLDRLHWHDLALRHFSGIASKNYAYTSESRNNSYPTYDREA